MSNGPTQSICFEDLKAGAVYGTGRVAVTAEDIIAFAERYDPQPVHMDPVAAEKTVFRGLAASGWHTASLTMRLLVFSEFRFGTGVVGLGVDTLKWPQPVRPGDELTAVIEVLAIRGSASKPDYGIAKLRTTTKNQRDEAVQIMVSHVLVPRRGQGTRLSNGLEN